MTVLSKGSLFTQIHKNNNKCCIVHARPVDGAITINKHYALPHIPIDWTCNTHAHNVTVFTNSRFRGLHRDINSLVFKKCALWNLFYEVCICRLPKRCRCVNEQPKCIQSFPFLVENSVVKAPPETFFLVLSLTWEKNLKLVIKQVAQFEA